MTKKETREKAVEFIKYAVDIFLETDDDQGNQWFDDNDCFEYIDEIKEEIERILVPIK